MKKIIATLSALIVAFGLAACTTEADTIEKNSKKDAESFNIQRRVTFINGITDKELLRVEGKCSYETGSNQFVVICKTGPKEYVRHTLVRSDNVTAVVEQTLPGELDPNHYKFIIRPQTLVPDVDVDLDSTKED